MRHPNQAGLEPNSRWTQNGNLQAKNMTLSKTCSSLEGKYGGDVYAKVTERIRNHTPATFSSDDIEEEIDASSLWRKGLTKTRPIVWTLLKRAKRLKTEHVTEHGSLLAPIAPSYAGNTGTIPAKTSLTIVKPGKPIASAKIVATYRQSSSFWLQEVSAFPCPLRPYPILGS